MSFIKRILRALVTLIVGIVATVTIYFIIISGLPTSEVKTGSVIVGIRYESNIQQKNCAWFGTPLYDPGSASMYLGCQPYSLTLPDTFNIWVQEYFHKKI